MAEPPGGDGGRPEDQPSPNPPVDDCTATLNQDGWCWGASNHPMGSLSSFVVFGNDDVWATAGQVLVHWDGKTWSPRFIMSDGYLPAMWGSSPTNVFAAGRRKSEGVLYRFDGKAWTEIATAPLDIYAMWGSSPTDIWLGTRSKGIYHFDGAKVTQAFAPSQSVGQVMRAFDGTGPNDVWAVGDQGDGTGPVRHYDGKSWTQGAGPFKSNSSMRTVHAFAANDVWVGGTSGQILHFDGVQWTTLALPSGLQGIVVAISGSANDVTFALTRDGGKNHVGDVALLHWNGQNLSTVPSPDIGEAYQPPIVALATTPSKRLLVSRGAGDVFQRENGVYTRQTSGPQIDFQSSSSAPNGRIAATGLSGNIAIYENGVWQSKTGIADAKTLGGVAAFDDGIYAVGNGRFLAFTAAGLETTTPFGTQTPGALAGISSADLWAMSSAGLWHRTGATWTSVTTTNNLSYFRKLFVGKNNQVYATSSTPEALMKLDGSTWQKAWTTPVRAATYRAGSIWAIRGGTLGLGNESSILKDDVVIPIPDAKLAQKSNYGELLAVCDDGRVYLGVWGYEILAFDGTSWRVESPTAGGLASLHCDAQGTVWGFGHDGVIVKKPKK